MFIIASYSCCETYTFFFLLHLLSVGYYSPGRVTISERTIGSEDQSRIPLQTKELMRFKH